MCKAPKPKKQKEDKKPQYLRNPYLDAAIGQAGAIDTLRVGRGSLRTDLNTGLGIRQPGQAISQPVGTTSGPANAPPGQPPNPLDQFRGLLPRLAIGL